MHLPVEQDNAGSSPVRPAHKGELIMPVLVFNKNTGKYLKKHGGSYNDLRFKVDQSQRTEKHPNTTLRAVEEEIFIAEPSDAKQYHTVTNARQAVGNSNLSFIGIPKYLELHRVKENVVTVEDEPIKLREHAQWQKEIKWKNEPRKSKRN